MGARCLYHPVHDSGGYKAAERQWTCGPNSGSLQHRNSPSMPPPSIRPPVHIGRLSMPPQWVQPTPAVPINAAEYGRPEQQVTSMHPSQYQGVDATNLVPVSHRPQMDPYAHIPPQLMQMNGQSLAEPSQYMRPVTQQGNVHHQPPGQQQVFQEIAAVNSYCASSGMQINPYSTLHTPASAHGGQILQHQAAYQPSQLASSSSYQQFPVQYSGLNEAQASHIVCFEHNRFFAMTCHDRISDGTDVPECFESSRDMSDKCYLIASLSVVNSKEDSAFSTCTCCMQVAV